MRCGLKQVSGERCRSRRAFAAGGGCPAAHNALEGINRQSPIAAGRMSGAPSGVSDALLTLDRRGIERLKNVLRKLLKLYGELIRDADLPPSDKALLAGCRRAVALGNVRRWKVGLQSPEDADHRLAAIGSQRPARLFQHKRLDDRPIKVSPFVTALRQSRLRLTNRNRCPQSACVRKIYVFIGWSGDPGFAQSTA